MSVFTKFIDPEGPDGWLKDADGLSYQSKRSLVQCGMFKFCGCGSSDGALPYVRDGLRLIDGRRTALPTSSRYDSPEWRAAWDEMKRAEIAHFGNEEAAEFFYWWADDKGYTEHGGSIPGWLTDKGREVLAFIDEALAEIEPD